jgi:hypothetical protein
MVRDGDIRNGIPPLKAGFLLGPYKAPYMTKPCFNAIVE